MAYGRVGLGVRTLRVPSDLRRVLPPGLARRPLPPGFRRRGMAAVTSCGDDPCKWTDSIPFFSSADCDGYQACMVALNHQLSNPTSSDAQIAALPVGGSAAGSLLDTTNIQSALNQFEASLEPPVASSFAWIQNYLPWLIGGFVAIAVLPSVLGGRR